MTQPTLETISNLAKKRGFVFQASEIYGGIRSAYDYGPLGVELLRNVKDEWWRDMVQLRDDVVGIDSAILQARQVWQASGHEEVFTDPLVECRNCNAQASSRQAGGPEHLPNLRQVRDTSPSPSRFISCSAPTWARSILRRT